MTVMDDPPAGRAVTFWNCPPPIIAGRTLTVALPEPSEDTLPSVIDDTTNVRRRPTLARFLGFTAVTPAIVIISPTLSLVAAAAVQPFVDRSVKSAQPTIMP